MARATEVKETRGNAETAAAEAIALAEEDYSRCRTDAASDMNTKVVRAQRCYPCCLTFQSLQVIEAGCNDCDLDELSRIVSR